MLEKIIKRLEENDPTLTEFRLELGSAANVFKWLGESYRKKFAVLPISTLFGEIYAVRRKNIAKVRANTHLRVLDLTSCGMCREISGIAQTLQVNTNLIELGLSGNSIDSQDVRAITRALESNPASQLRVLGLNNNQIGYEGAQAIAQLLKINTSLKELWLHLNNLGNQGASVIAQSLKTNSSLRSLSLGGNEIDEKGAGAIAQSLAINTSLRKLFLERNLIGNKGTVIIANAIQKNKASKLDTLDLGSNGIGVEGAKAIGRMLAANPPLKTLNLENNEIYPEGLEAITTAVQNNTQLINLNLSNPRLDNQGARLIAKMLAANPPLKTLSLCSNLCFIVMDRKDLEAIYEALKTNTHLTRLEIVPGLETSTPSKWNELFLRGEERKEYKLLCRIQKRIEENKLLESKKDKNAALIDALQEEDTKTAKFLLANGADIPQALALSPSEEITAKLITLHPAYQALMARGSILYERQNKLGENQNRNLKKREALAVIERKITEENSSLCDIRQVIIGQQDAINQSTGWTSRWGSPFQDPFVTSRPLLKHLLEDIDAALSELYLSARG